MWVADDESNKIYAYSLSTKQRQGSDDFDTLNAAENTSPRGLWSDDETMWVADEADAKIYSYNLASKAREDTKEFDTSSSDGNSSPQGIWSAAVVHNVAALDRPPFSRSSSSAFLIPSTSIQVWTARDSPRPEPAASL